MPILEAQTTGRVVLTSNRASMPEVGGNGAHYVDPYSVEEIREGIAKLVEDENYRNQLIEHGRQNATRFSPANIANQYMAIYDEIRSNT